MRYLVTTAFARANHAAAIWPRIRTLTGELVHWVIAVDGDPRLGWHEVGEVYEVAARYADQVVCLSRHGGNGAALAAAFRLIPVGEPVINLDADILPSQGFVTRLHEQAAAMDDGRLGLLAAATPDRRQKIGTLRRARPGARVPHGLCLHTARGRAAVGDPTTTVPIGGLEVLLAKRLARVGLWQGETDVAWVADHPSERDDPASAYNRWKAPYLSR